MNTAVTRNDWVGRVIDGRFPLLEWLGSSEKAGIFRTELIEPPIRRAVIRVLPADAEDPENRLRDWAAAAKLSHPNLMPILESGRTTVGNVDLLYVVTEYAEESLSQVIPERPLSGGEAREMLIPILDALSYLHAQGLVHGHVKPSNILVVNDRLKLPIDMLRPASRSSHTTAALSVYDAPEVAAGDISSAADIWSLGVTLVEALTQNPPSWDRSANKDPLVPAEIPEPFDQIAGACLRRDPSKRASPKQISDLLSGRPLIAEPRTSVDQEAPAETPAPSHAGGLRMGVIGAVFLVAIALIAFLMMRSHPPETPSTPSVSSSQPSSPQTPPSTPQATPSTAAPAAAPPPTSAPSPTSPPPSGANAKGAVSERVMPDVAASANRTIHGTVQVRIRLNVDANGVVSQASFDAQGPSRYFSSKALEAARKWQFKPAYANDQAVPSVWELRFEFRRDGPEISAKQVSP